MIRFPSLRSRLAPFIALAALVGSVLALDAQAASLQISPVSINLRANQAASGINLQNLGERPVYGQVRVFAWDQRNGEDVLTPTDELVASPPIIEVGAKGSQTIRLVRKGGAAAGAAPGNPERTYRLLIDEIPREDEQASGVAIRLQYSVPVFVAPVDEAAAPNLAWSVLRKDNAWVLRVRTVARCMPRWARPAWSTAPARKPKSARACLATPWPGANANGACRSSRRCAWARRSPCAPT